MSSSSLSSFVLITILSLFNYANAQGEGSDVTLINSRVPHGLVCGEGSNEGTDFKPAVQLAKVELNQKVALGDAITRNGRRGVKIELENDKVGIALFPIVVSNSTVTVLPGKIGDATWMNATVCVTVTSRAQ